MTALAQGSAGLALVMGFALLRPGRLREAMILLIVQCSAVAVTAVVLQSPLLAVPPLLLGGGTWLLRQEMTQDERMPTGGTWLGIGLGAVLAMLCQSQGRIAMPLSIVLLSVLLAATRSDRRMQLVALIAAQNGIALAFCLAAPPLGWLPEWPPRESASLLAPAACLILPLPLAAGLMAPAWVRGPRPQWLAGLPRLALPARKTRSTLPDGKTGSALRARGTHAEQWPGWIDLVLSLIIAATTLIVPVHALAAIFAPLLGLDGVLRAWVRRQRPALTALRRAAALAQTGFSIVAVCAPDLLTAWLAVLGAVASAELPVLPRRCDSAVLAFLAAGVALFGIMLLQGASPVLGYFSLFAGFAAIAAVVPELAVVLVILILRLANRMPWPPAAAALGAAIALAALLACALLLVGFVRPHRTTMLVLGQASIAALTICLGQPDGRFAALVLLVLLILTRTAARIPHGPAATLALAGLGGIPPLGMFPGLVLVALALSAHDPWMLLPVGAALAAFAAAGVPRRLPEFARRSWVFSIAWLPLGLAAFTGYFAPHRLVQWWHLLTAGGT